MPKKPSRVYVIDDDESVRNALARLLRSANFDTETFGSADAFLTSQQQKKEGCVVVDFRMPESTGFDLQQKLIASGVRMPVIVISASDESSVREHARQLGAVAFFRKPVDDQALIDAIWWALSGAQQDDDP